MLDLSVNEFHWEKSSKTHLDPPKGNRFWRQEAKIQVLLFG